MKLMLLVIGLCMIACMSSAQNNEGSVSQNSSLSGLPPRDASAAAIAASALIELSAYSGNRQSKKYMKTAERILSTLLSPACMGSAGENESFILKHGVGSFPGGIKVDVPLAYTDYYFVEAMLWYKNILKG